MCVPQYHKHTMKADKTIITLATIITLTAIIHAQIHYLTTTTTSTTSTTTTLAECPQQCQCLSQQQAENEYNNPQKCIKEICAIEYSRTPTARIKITKYCYRETIEKTTTSTTTSTSSTTTSTTTTSTTTSTANTTTSSSSTSTAPPSSIAPGLVLSQEPINPDSQQKVTFTADSEKKLTDVRLNVNNQTVKECNKTPCSYTGGPYPQGINLFDATAKDNEGNTIKAVNIIIAGTSYHIPDWNIMGGCPRCPTTGATGME